MTGAAGRLARIVRHPIKSLGYEEIDRAGLTPGAILPGDRQWALAHEAAKFQGNPAGWVSHLNFVRGAAAPALMAIRARTGAEGLTLTHPDRAPLTFDPATLAGGAALIDWLGDLWPANRPAPRGLVSAPGQPLTDVAEPFVSVLSLTSLVALGRAMGRELSPHRFRGNLWIDGLPDGAERGWAAGQMLRMGAVTLEVVEPITRCRATCGDPETGREEGDTLAALEALHGDRDFGVYARVTAAGSVALGDEVQA